MSAPNYHKSATKDVRPFFGVAALEHALDGALIRLYEGQPFEGGSSFVVEERDLPKLSIAVRPNLASGTLASGGIPLAELALAVIASNPFLKRTVVVYREGLAAGLPDDITVGAEALDRLGGGGNLRIEVALCLGTTAKREPGRPFLAGHWLAKRSFDLRVPKAVEDFDIDALEDADWVRLGYPPKTLYQVEYFGGVNEPVSKERPLVKVRVHADVHKKLASETQAKAARPLLAFLAAEIPCQILASSFADWKDAESVELKSPLSSFLKRINKVHPCSLAELRELVQEQGMPKLRAILHADQECVRRIGEL